MGHVGTGIDAARHEDRDGVAELCFIGPDLGQDLRQDVVQRLAGPGKKLFFRKAEMPARLAAFDHQKVSGPAKGFGPAAQDELCRPAAGYDGGDGYVRRVHKAGQFQRQTRTGHHGVHASFDRCADGGGIVLRGYHRIDGHHASALGEVFGLSDLRRQRAVVGADRVAGKIRFPVACIGGGDAPHAAAGRYGPGQPAQRNAYTHAALQDGDGQSLFAEGQHSSFSAAMRCLPLFHRSSRMSATGRTSWSIPAT